MNGCVIPIALHSFRRKSKIGGSFRQVIGGQISLDTIKMVAYSAETSLVSIVRKHLARSDDARTLIRQIFESEADLLHLFLEVRNGRYFDWN